MEAGHHHRYLGKIPLSPESAIAADIFDQFICAQTFKAILATFRHLCETLRIKPTNFPQFYPKLKAKLPSWKAQAIWAKFEKRASHKCYQRGKACANTRVLIIGGGPCGLRAAIEAQLLGAKVVVIEKRDRFSRNNVLHLWPFVIHDLRALGAKKFFGKFCAGSIDHISIRQLQCVLLKVCLLLGVEVHENVAFEKLIEPPENQAEENISWRAQVSPADHPISQYEFHVLIGADGKRNTLQGFKRKEFRGKLAIAITANFINRHSEQEARVEEISGVAFIFNQKFFQEMREVVGIDLENIVYYKDDTHYFVMTAKKHSLIDKGVILNDYSDTAKLLAPDNVDREALMDYAREAADFATNYCLPNPEFAVNHYGQADVAMFDFTSMYAAENACKVLERRGHKLLLALVGDSLLEPFWPTGSGCARGFLSSLDACWMIRSWSSGTMTPLQVLAQRESIHRLLAQTTPENLNKDFNEYMLNPQSRYPNLIADAVRPAQVISLYDTDSIIEKEAFDSPAEMPKKKQKKGAVIHPDTLLHWCQRQIALYDNLQIENMTTSWKSGMALGAIINRYRPDLLDFHSLKEEDVEKNNDLAFQICEREFGIPPVMTGQEMLECETPDKLSMVSYVSQLYDVFRGEIPHIARPLMQRSPSDELEPPLPAEKRMSSGRLNLLARVNQRLANRKSKLSGDRDGTAGELNERLPKKRKSLERERALFITQNKENNRSASSQPILPIFGEGKPIPFSDRVKSLEELLSGGRAEIGVGEVAQRRHLLDLDLCTSSLNEDTNSERSRVKVGKLERGNWNVKMLEERLKERNQEKKTMEGVPKWSRECFQDKLKVMDDKSRGTTEDNTQKFSDFDERLRQLDRKLKEGSALETGQRGSNKVAVMAEQLASVLEPKQEHPPLIQTNARPSMTTGGSEKCHFCQKRVYLMERVSAQGKFFHRGCFKCEYCGTILRLGSYGYTADGNFGGRFLCMQHFGMPLNFPKRPMAIRGVAQKISINQGEERSESFLVVDGLTDKMRGATPERAEFENSIIADQTTEDETLSEMDEDEWTDRNFGTSANELESTDEESDFSSEEISDSDEVLEAFQHSISTEETRRLAETWKRKHTQDGDGDRSVVEETDEDYVESDDEFSYKAYENEGAITDSDVWASSPDQDQDEARPLRLDESSIGGQSRTPDSIAVSNDLFGSTSETESTTSNENSSSEYDEETEEEAEKKGWIGNTIHEIPSIVIDEFSSAHVEQSQEVPSMSPSPELSGEKTLREDEKTGLEDIILPSPELFEEEILLEEEKPSENVTEDKAEIVTTLPVEISSCDETDPGTLSSGVLCEETESNELLLEPFTDEKFITQDLSLTELVNEISLEKPPQLFELSLESNVIFRKKGSEALRREMDVKSVIEPLENLPQNEFMEEDSTKTPGEQLESANSLPNLAENQEPKKEDVASVSRTLKLKERYLLGESSPQQPIPQATSGKPTTKLEPLVKNFLDMITEKQKMLTPSPPSSTFLTSMYSKLSPSLISENAGFKVSCKTDLIQYSKVNEDERIEITPEKVEKVVEPENNSVAEEVKPEEITNAVEPESNFNHNDFDGDGESSFDLDDKFVTIRRKKSRKPKLDDTPELLAGEAQSQDNETLSLVTEKNVVSSPPIIEKPPLPRYEGQFSKKVSPFQAGMREIIDKAKSTLNKTKTEAGTEELEIPVQSEKLSETLPETLVKKLPTVSQQMKSPEDSQKKPEEIPFADDEEQTSSYDLNTEFKAKPVMPGSQVPKEILRELRSVEREKARQLARERARLKSDEELGLAKINPKTRLDFGDAKSSLKLDDLKKKSSSWSGFGKKQRKSKSSVEQVGTPKLKDGREQKGLLSMLTSFAKSDVKKGKVKDKSPLSATKMQYKIPGISQRLKDNEDVKQSAKSAVSNNVSESPRRRRSATAPKALGKLDSFSESEEDVLHEMAGVASSSSTRDKEVTEEKMRKLQRMAQRLYKRQEQKRLRTAQEIQRQLEEVEVEQRQLELRGVQVEKALRGEGDDDNGNKDESKLMEEWFALVREKNLLVRREEELLVRAKDLELQDRHNRLQQSLSDMMAIEDSKKTPEEIEDEGRILNEMLDIMEQRDALVAFLEEEDRFSIAMEDDNEDDTKLIPVAAEAASTSTCVG